MAKFIQLLDYYKLKVINISIKVNDKPINVIIQQ
jgi:hypothetical protein